MSEALGFFGKLPAHGDFIDRNLPRSFLAAWDQWLQRSLVSSREWLGDPWLEIYLTSPIWRFAISCGALDQGAWAGIMMPSVDAVGRYFPLTIATAVPPNNNLFELLSSADSWFAALETAALSALQNHGPAEQLSQALVLVPRLPVLASTANTGLSALDTYRGVRLARGADTATHYRQLLHAELASQQSYSLWHCQGSQHMSPTTLAVPGLPTAEHYTAFLDGHWGARH